MATYNEITERADRGDPITGSQQTLLDFVRAILPPGFADLMLGEQRLWLEALREDLEEHPHVFVARHRATLEVMAEQGPERLREVAKEVLRRGGEAC